MLKKNELPYIPENILECPGYKEQMAEACQIYEQQIKPQIYDQPKAEADEIEM